MNNQLKLDLSSLQKALISLDEALVEYQKNISNSFIRDAVIQRFEYTYELSHKMLKRYLEITEPNAAEIDQMSFPNLIRTGFERGLVHNSWDIWKIYDEARNATSHTYSTLTNAFEESDLPYKVDLVDLYAIDDSFQQQIEAHKILLWKK